VESLRDQAISYAVAERDKCHDHERRENIADVSPVDLGDLSNHHATNLFISLVLSLVKEELRGNIPESMYSRSPKVGQMRRWVQRKQTQ
jgi:hypothetical protein